MLIAQILLTLSLLLIPLDCIQCPHRAKVCIFSVVTNTGMSLCKSLQDNIALSWYQVLQQCIVCLICLTWMVSEMEGKWPYSCRFEGCWGRGTSLVNSQDHEKNNSCQKITMILLK